MDESSGQNNARPFPRRKTNHTAQMLPSVGLFVTVEETDGQKNDDRQRGTQQRMRLKQSSPERIRRA